MFPREIKRDKWPATKDTPLCRRRMYTAVSRATHRVTALSQGPVTPLLPSLRG
ncbi:hypothetical protein [Paratractidigestivibacter faecalis]|uniref:UvrD-like helicase C-terminal domain-containing protein n=1 Tax=Paratractidigestivibacter faecalis TaxID=2292441 RepID=A0ABV1IIB1_9ACTN